MILLCKNNMTGEVDHFIQYFDIGLGCHIQPQRYGRTMLEINWTHE